MKESAWLPWLTGSFCQDYAQVQITVQVIKRSEVLQKLERQDVSFAIMSGRVDHPDLVYENFKTIWC